MRKILFFIIVSSLFVGCNKKSGFEIVGTVNNTALNGEYVYLYEYTTRETAPLDSSLVQNGSFVFKGTKENKLLHTISFARYIIEPNSPNPGENPVFSSTFILDNSIINITLDSISTATGTDENDSIAALQKRMSDLRVYLNQLSDDLKSDNKEIALIAEGKYGNIDSTINAMAKTYILTNLNKLSAGKLLYDFRYNFSEDERNEIVNNADSVLLSTPGVDRIVEHLVILKGVGVGEQFKDFEMNDIKGKSHKLSEYVGNGKVTLIDFWASWCPPCRREMPYLVAAYKKYKHKGFEIVGVSLDSKKESWEKGIKDLGISWIQLSDLNGWKNEGGMLYGVNLIPHLVLIDKEGKIIAKYLKGEELDKKISEVLK